MWIFNCARVYVGNYSGGHIASMAQDDTYFNAKCGYNVLQGEVSIKNLRPVRVRGAQDEAGESKFTQDHIVKAVVLYPKTDESIIEVFSRNGKYKFKLVKSSGKSTMYKMRL